MKMLLPLLLPFFVACASGDGFIDDTVRTCQPGDEIEINAGFEQSATSGGDNYDDRLTLLVQIANNSDADIVVNAIRVDPSNPMGERKHYELVGGRIEPRRTIAEADESMFEIPMSARRISEHVPYGFSGVADVAVIVELDGGTRYRCQFRVVR